MPLGLCSVCRGKFVSGECQPQLADSLTLQICKGKAARSASEPQALGTEESLEVTTVESFLCLFQRFFISWLICIKKDFLCHPGWSTVA
ncbi:guanine nucleotide-binding protein G(I)/G(S)/G(O) subunit gamma-2 isoform X2 [Hylobates moloch]|uniref:guanine nucleotide-binding protein G(I)/G(S)/G(O) subunit gamma-2 isoform X2 n=1 Tax=Hylobates moloch TaxID=81572 RepID=UPI0026745CFB|nr:guanine nucleotide-binding protein G(I)/G(S)/G(O) subunit gamma-2 isoform X2 [Hylobates moloch]